MVVYRINVINERSLFDIKTDIINQDTFLMQKKTWVKNIDETGWSSYICYNHELLPANC